MAQDEGRFGRISRPQRCWAPPGIRPHAPAQLIRESVYVFAAVAPAIGELVSLILPESNTAMMNLFLEEVSQTFSKFFIVMQVDGAGWHCSNHLVVPSNIRLIEQPPYSPEVNPAEHLWDELREKQLHNRAFSSLDELIEVLCQGLNAPACDPVALHSLTGFPHIINVEL
jgi:hypothetical protein